MNKKIALLVITDGRKDFLRRTIMSFEEKVAPYGNFVHRVMVDDSGDKAYAEMLGAEYIGRRNKSDDFIIVDHLKRRGFAGAIQSGWQTIRPLLPDTEFVFHLEDDFTFEQEVPISDMVDILETHPYVSQVCLKRQPIGPEIEFGGFMEQWPKTYNDKDMTILGGRPRHIRWTEHQNFWSTNPSLYPADIMKIGWPDAPDSEAKFGPLLWNAGFKAAFLGHKADPPLVHHIGDHRVGINY